MEGQAEERQPRPPAADRSFLVDDMQERKIGGHKSKASHEKQRCLSMAVGYLPLPPDVPEGRTGGTIFEPALAVCVFVLVYVCVCMCVRAIMYVCAHLCEIGLFASVFCSCLLCGKLSSVADSSMFLS